MNSTQTRALAVFGLLFSATGCFNYVYHDREPQRPEFKVPIDENNPRSDIRWSLWWSQAHVWKPVACLYRDGSTHYVYGDEPDPECQSYFAICEHGSGRTQVQLLFYSIPLAILTLGIAMPAEVTVYCSAASSPTGPSGPSGPSGPE